MASLGVGVGATDNHHPSCTCRHIFRITIHRVMFQVVIMTIQIQMNTWTIQYCRLKIRNIDFLGFIMPYHKDPLAFRYICKHDFRPWQLRIAIRVRETIWVRKNRKRLAVSFVEGRGPAGVLASGCRQAVAQVTSGRPSAYRCTAKLQT